MAIGFNDVGLRRRPKFDVKSAGRTRERFSATSFSSVCGDAWEIFRLLTVGAGGRARAKDKCGFPAQTKRKTAKYWWAWASAMYSKIESMFA